MQYLDFHSQAGYYDQRQSGDQELRIPVSRVDVERAPIDLTTQSSGFPDKVPFPFLSDHGIHSYGVRIIKNRVTIGKFKAYVWNRGNQGHEKNGIHNNPWNKIENDSQFQERMNQQYKKILDIIDKDSKASIFLLQESLDLYNGSDEFIQNLAQRNWKVVLFSSNLRVKFNALIYNNRQMDLLFTKEFDIYKKPEKPNPFYNTLIGNFKLREFNGVEVEIGSTHLLRSEKTGIRLKKFFRRFQDSNPNKSALFLGGDTNHYEKKNPPNTATFGKYAYSKMSAIPFKKNLSTYYIGNSEFLDRIPTLYPNNTYGRPVNVVNRVNFSLGTPNPATGNTMIITEKMFTSFSIKFVTNREGNEEIMTEQRQINPKVEYPHKYKHISLYGLPITCDSGISQIQIRE